jgi:Tfp pilus assembly protein PilF
MSRWPFHLAVCVMLCGSGCHLTDSSLGTYETIEGNPHRDAQVAIRKNEHALRRMEHEDFAKAEELLQESLVADVTFAPAHNNLGHLYFLQRKYYLAAWEFEYAAKLMPTSGEPLNNLVR